jgi:hypothetical protein
MVFALVLRELLTRWRLLIVGGLIAVIAAVFSVYHLDGLTLKARGLKHSSASTQVLVDTPASSLGDLRGSFEPLNVRAVVYANFMTTPAVLDLIGKQIGISGDQIYAAGPVDPNLSRTVQEPTALKRNAEITGETTPYRLNYTTDPNLPTVGVNAQAPTTKEAVALANGAVVGLQEYVAALQKNAKVPTSSKVVVRQVGEASGGVDNPGISKMLAGIVFVLVFLLWCVLVLVGVRFSENWRASAKLYGVPDGHVRQEAGQAQDGGEDTVDTVATSNGREIPEPAMYDTIESESPVRLTR